MTINIQTAYTKTNNNKQEGETEFSHTYFFIIYTFLLSVEEYFYM